MAKDTGRAEPAQDGHVCPTCKRPVETVVHRRKVLGAFVPVWGPGPCQHEDCPSYSAEGETAEESRPRHHNRHRRAH